MLGLDCYTNTVMKSAKSMPVSRALYHAYGKPSLGKDALFDRGFCGSCGVETDVALAQKIFTRRFGSWDSIATSSDANKRFICLPCGWAWRSKELMHISTIINRETLDVIHPTGERLREFLAGPIPETTAVLVPTSGKKALAGLAQWGRLTTDSGPQMWRPRHHRALTALIRLKALGFSERDLAETHPPFVVRQTLDAADWATVDQLWAVIAPHQGDRNFYPALLKLTREKL